VDQQTGKYIIFIGAAILLVGLLVYFLHDKLHWLGRLPGDIRVERENFRFYLPITTMVIISLLATVLVNLIKKFL
jgi:uncharacterized membrane protein